MWPGTSPSAARREAAAELLVSVRCNITRSAGIYDRVPAVSEWGYIKVPCIRGVVREISARGRIAQVERLGPLVGTELDKQCVEDVEAHRLFCEMGAL